MRKNLDCSKHGPRGKISLMRKHQCLSELKRATLSDLINAKGGPHTMQSQPHFIAPLVFISCHPGY